MYKPSYHSADLCLRRLKRRRMSSSASSSVGISYDGADRTPGLLSARKTGGTRRRGACINGAGRENCCMPDVLGNDPPLVPL